MEQQEYQYRMNQKPLTKPENRFWHIWGPLFIKWGIAFAVSMAAGFIFEVYMIIKESGADINGMRNIAQVQAVIEQYMSQIKDSTEFARQMAQEFLQYTTPVEGFAALVTIPVMIVMFHRDRIKEKISGVVPNKKAALWKYAGIFIMAAAMTLGLNNLIEISGIYKASESYESTMNSLYAASLPMQVICLGILVPVCEELVFRGLTFQRMRQSTTFLRAALYSSGIFAFLHGNLVQMLYGFFMGLTFCYLYEKYGSVKAPVFAHMTANILSVILTETKALDWMAEKEIRMGLITVACAGLSATMYVLIQKIEEKPDIKEGFDVTV